MREGASKARRAGYALALAALCALPVFTMVSSSSDAYLARLPFLSFAGDSCRVAGYVFAALAFVCIGFGAYVVFGKASAWLDRCDTVKLPRLLATPFTRKGILITAAIIFICWIPVLYALYPCATTTYDTIDQLYQAFSDPPLWYFSTNTVVDASIIDHHPWFDTLLFGMFGWIGRSLGSDAIGLFLYGALQTALSALVLSAAICYLERLGVPSVLRLVSLAFVIFFPVFPATADTMQKDSLYSLAILVYALMFLEAYRTKGAALKNVRFLIGFAIVIALCILTKKTGVYVIGLSSLVMLISLQGVRIRTLASFVAPAAVCLWLFPALLFGPLKIAPGGSQEVLGIMYQQAATVLTYDPESVSDQAREAIDGVLDVDAAVRDYRPTYTDYVKRWARDDATTDDYKAFFSTWAELGASHIGLYLQSMASCFSPLLVPSEGFKLNTDVSEKGVEFYASHAEAIGGEFHLDAVSPEANQGLAWALYSFFYYGLRTVPVISLFCTMGFYDAWIPLAALAVALYTRRKRDACALAPIIANALFLIVSPAALPRYALCMVFLAVPTIGWAIRCLRNPRSRQKRS